jgi:hypothetical protein
MIRQAVEIECFDVRHRSASGKTGYVRHGGARAQVQKHLVAGDSSRPARVQRDFDGSRSDKPCSSHDEFRAASLVSVEVNIHQILHHFSFAELYTGHVYGRYTELKTKLCTAPHE